MDEMNRMSKMNRERALKEFENYTANYDLSNIGVSLKISHTYRVAAISERIAESVANGQGIVVDFAWLFGLLHDIGRFEQITRYGTFKDALSVDHAELGADILFRENLFEKFADVPHEIRGIAETVIRLHNKLRLPENISPVTKTYAKILRDADKIDIFRVLTEPPYNKRDLKGLLARDEIMQCVREHRCVPRPSGDFQYNELEALISQCCMAFELEYNKSRAIVVEQGYLKKLLSYDSGQLETLREEIIEEITRG